MAKNYIPQISVYYTEKNYNEYNNAIQNAIKRFKDYYSRFDKRLLTTKKKVNVNLKGKVLNVNIDVMIYLLRLAQIVPLFLHL